MTAATTVRVRRTVAPFVMRAAVVLATFLAWAVALFAKWRERSQLAMYAAIGLTLIMVPAVLLFVASDVPFI